MSFHGDGQQIYPSSLTSHARRKCEIYLFQATGVYHRLCRVKPTFTVFPSQEGIEIFSNFLVQGDDNSVFVSRFRLSSSSYARVSFRKNVSILRLSLYRSEGDSVFIQGRTWT